MLENVVKILYYRFLCFVHNQTKKTRERLNWENTIKH